MRRTSPSGIMDCVDPLEKTRVVGKEETFYVSREEHGIG
jgi:hypothetical protein